MASNRHARLFLLQCLGFVASVENPCIGGTANRLINWMYRGQRCVKRGWGTDDTHGWFVRDGGGVCRSLREARNVWKDVLEWSRFVGVGTFKVVWRKKRKGVLLCNFSAVFTGGDLNTVPKRLVRIF